MTNLYNLQDGQEVRILNTEISIHNFNGVVNLSEGKIYDEIGDESYLLIEDLNGKEWVLEGVELPNQEESLSTDTK